MCPVIREVAVWQDSCVSAWSGGQGPSVYFLAVCIDHAYCAGARQVGEEDIAWRDCLVVNTSKTNTTSVE